MEARRNTRKIAVQAVFQFFFSKEDVYKVLEDNSVEKIEVSVGKRSYGKIMILEGLDINDKIIKEGISKVRNKMKVKIVNQ